jgi:tetratricopeptide (TPR) repeat protein
LQTQQSVLVILFSNNNKMTTTMVFMKGAWTFSFFLGVCAWAFIPEAQAQEAALNSTRCENSFGKESVGNTIETCRLELTGPVTQPKRVKILETLGKAYLAQNEPDLAISTWNEASQYSPLSREDQSAAESWTRLQVLIGQTYAQANQTERAETHFQKTLNTVEQAVGRYSLPAGMVQDALGGYYALQNKAAEAEAAYKRSRIVYEIRLGKTNARTLETRMNHAVGLLDMQKEQEAMENFQVLAEIINSSAAYTKEPIRAEILTFLGTLQMRSDQLENAARNYQTAFEVRQAAFGPNDIRTSQSLNNLGVVLYRAGDLKRAEAALSRAYIIRADALGSEDPLTLSTQKNLQAVIAAQNAANKAPAESGKRN